MKIVSLTKIRNEADIIESFVKYHCNIFDTMYFVENGSTDGTTEILQALKNEGYSIEIFDERGSKFDRLKFATKYLYTINNLENIDWIVPIDADEFICSSDRNNPREEIQKCQGLDVIWLSWRVYCYQGEVEEKSFIPLHYNKFWNEKTQRQNKVIFSTNCLKDNNFMLLEGYHNYLTEKNLNEDKIRTIFLAHYPVRSIEQIKKQILINGLNLILEENSKNISTHWRYMYEDIKNNKIDLIEMSKHYVKQYNTDMNLYEGIIDVSNCECLKIEYGYLQKNSLEFNLINYCENIAIRNRILNLNMERILSKNDKKKVIIYGVGSNCFEKEKYIRDEYNIIAYADSDKNKQYTTYNNILVIPPEKISGLQWDYIIISSDKYYDEIRNDLKKMDITDNVLLLSDVIVRMFIDDANNYIKL